MSEATERVTDKPAGRPRLDIGRYAAVLSVDDTEFKHRLETCEGIIDELKTELARNQGGIRPDDHVFPSGESTMASDESGPGLPVQFFRALNAACINHCLKGLKVRVIRHERIGE